MVLSATIESADVRDLNCEIYVTCTILSPASHGLIKYEPSQLAEK